MIGKKLKQLREGRKFTQEGVAIELGVASSTYSDYERGVLNVPANVVVKAADLYKVDLSHFYSLRGPVSITMNDQSSNGYVENLQQTSPAAVEKWMRTSEEREARLLDFIKAQAATLHEYAALIREMKKGD